MNNFKKEGYSTAETAQIFHCSKSTVLLYIYNGELKASASDSKVRPGKRRRIRVLKEHIGEYMLNHRDRFTKEELDTWGKFVKQQNPIEKAITEEAHSLSELTGALAGLVNPKVVSPEPASAPVAEEKPDIEIQYLDSYSISIDGRISVGNVSAITAGKIINALLEDKQISYNELTIRKGTCIK